MAVAVCSGQCGPEGGRRKRPELRSCVRRPAWGLGPGRPREEVRGRQEAVLPLTLESFSSEETQVLGSLCVTVLPVWLCSCFIDPHLTIPNGAV